MARAWLFGNTTVRTPLRLQEGLRALVTSGFLGIVEGENEAEFAWALHRAGVVELSESTDDVSSIARKWRSALCKLGFLVPKVTPITGVSQLELGPKFTVTPNGQRLLSATSVPAIQEIFLRALASIQLPSPNERGFDEPAFSPLQHTLRIMLALDELCASSHINFIEMATIVQLSSGAQVPNLLAAEILALRTEREAAINKKAFDRLAAQSAEAANGLSWKTYFDYADTNFRYLKSTGLVQNKGRGITLVPEQRVLAQELAEELEPSLTPIEYFRRLFAGATLPTDSQGGALMVLESLAEIAESRGVGIDVSIENLSTPADIALVRFELEDRIFHSKEEDFAAQQASQIDAILATMSLINERKGQLTLPSGEEVKVPLNEMPAYFEWVLWRTFLAIRHHVSKPHEIRRFNIDQDFLPIGTAPGGGADLIVEYDDFVVVIEVTLTESSRQEAAEGEPVRRHVAEIVEMFEPLGKTVYGLFVAKKIDSNTAETFRIGVWYKKDDVRMIVDVVPLSLGQFREIVKEMFDSGNVSGDVVRGLLERMTAIRHETTGAPEWKLRIAEALTAGPI